MEATTCKKELAIEIPVDVVQREADSVAGQFAKRARIPGFRPGHAPTSLVRQHFRDDIRSEVAQTLIPRFFQTAVKDQKWEIVGQPRFEDLKFEDDQPLTCKATFEIYPEFELQPYKELEVEEEQARLRTPTWTRQLRNCAKAPRHSRWSLTVPPRTTTILP